MSLRWSSIPPQVPGFYMFRHVDDQQGQDDCRAIVKDDGTLEVLRGDGESLYNLADYEFAGPFPMEGE